jgi:hypothetical protein
MEDELTAIELLVTKLALEQKMLQLLERRRAVQRHHAGAEIRAVELLLEKLRLEKMRETLRERRVYERRRQESRSGFFRAL